jgi:hypothetical protein
METQDYINIPDNLPDAGIVENDFPAPKKPSTSAYARHEIEDRRYNVAADLW